jgi:hypothetical protein
MLDAFPGGIVNLAAQGCVISSTEKLTQNGHNQEQLHGRFSFKLFPVDTPLMFITELSFHDAVDLFLILRAFKPQAVGLGFASLVHWFCLNVAVFYSQACATRVSGLFGPNGNGDASEGRSFVPLSDAVVLFASIYHFSHLILQIS